MLSEPGFVDVAPSVLASVRRRVAWRDVPAAIRAQLDLVWAFLRAPGAPVRQAGHNVCVYHGPDEEGVELEAGVQVSGSFVDAGEVRCSAAPSGRAQHVAYHGGYGDLGEAHDALGGPGLRWEVYGDWCADETKLRTDVYRLV